MYDGDMAGDDDDESDLRCLLLRTDSDVVTNADVDVDDDMSDAVVAEMMAFVMAV